MQPKFAKKLLLKHWLKVWMVLATVIMACNLPLAPPSERPVPPTQAPLPTATTDPLSNLVPTVTLPSASVPDLVSTATNTPAPTDTPAPDTPTPGPPTETPLPTFTPISIAATATPLNGVDPFAATETPSGPLDFDYEISWRLDPNDGTLAIAFVRITATGGDGNYTFFRDDKPTSGAEFEYFWGRCQNNPGWFTVTSGDGQSVTIGYETQAACG